MGTADSWRFKAIHDGETISLEASAGFDELVVGTWFHLENMDKDLWWLRVGDAKIMVRTPANGEVTVEVERNAY